MIGQTVIIEEAFCIASINTQNYSQCANCFQRNVNFIPCENCSAVMFCSLECYNIGHEKFHDMECGKPGVYSQWDVRRRLVMQTVIRVIKLFPNVHQLMDLIEKLNIENPKVEEQAFDEPSIRAYMQFFGLARNIEYTSKVKDLEFIEFAKSIHSMIKSSAAQKSTFRSLETSRFLAHLILHHSYVVDTNAFEALRLIISIRAYMAPNPSGFIYAHGIYPNSSRLNHSCQPNIVRIFIGNKLIAKVIRPIKRGEQLFRTCELHFTLHILLLTIYTIYYHCHRFHSTDNTTHYLSRLQGEACKALLFRMQVQFLRTEIPAIFVGWYREFGRADMPTTWFERSIDAWCDS